jgi:hypothetical protein
MSDAISIRRFMWLLDQRGYSYIPENRLEQVVTVRGGKRPDFLVDTRFGVRFLAEVKAFEEPTALDRATTTTGAIFVGDLQKRINAGVVARASKQLAPYSNDRLPLVVVVDNHRQIGISLGTLELIQIFGTIQYEFTVDTATGSSVSEGWAHSNADYAVGDKRRPHISAVVVNVPTQRFDTFDAADDFTRTRPMRVHVIHNPDATNPLPLWVFSEPHDKQIIRQGDRWVEFSSPPEEVRRVDLARRAYEKFESGGRKHGHHLENWLEAEREALDQIGRLPE